MCVSAVIVFKCYTRQDYDERHRKRRKSENSPENSQDGNTKRLNMAQNQTSPS